MVQKLTENGHNARGPLRYLTTVVVELYTEAQTGTEWHRLTQTVRRTDRRIEGRRRRRADNNQWDAICNRDDCHADITHRSAVRGLVPSSPPRLKKTATMPYHHSSVVDGRSKTPSSKLTANRLAPRVCCLLAKAVHAIVLF